MSHNLHLMALSAFCTTLLVACGGDAGPSAPAGGGAGAGSSRVALPARLQAEGERARQKGGLLLVDVTAEWCRPCQEMEETTWPDPVLSGWLEEHAVFVQVDADDAGAARELKVRSIPTMILFRDGEEVERKTGYRTAEQMLAWLESHARTGG